METSSGILKSNLDYSPKVTQLFIPFDPVMLSLDFWPQRKEEKDSYGQKYLQQLSYSKELEDKRVFINLGRAKQILLNQELKPFYVRFSSLVEIDALCLLEGTELVRTWEKRDPYFSGFQVLERKCMDPDSLKGLFPEGKEIVGRSQYVEG